MSQTTSTSSTSSNSSDTPAALPEFEQLVSAELRQIRHGLNHIGYNKADLFQTSVLRSVLHIALDWASLFAALWAAMQWGWWVVPASLLVIGNRQRALGNVLHDCGHRNVSRQAQVNDLIARALVAPLLFADFEHYRKTHLAHHMHLGHPQHDPDYIPSAGANRNCWRETFHANLLNPRLWISTLVGDFAKPQGAQKLLYIALWWTALLVLIGAIAGWQTASVFLALWLAARATVFFLITLFREMCDHFGRTPGGIFQFTRDITARGVLRYIIHPKNNGYHLTHHLLPTVPYYHLPTAHQALLKLSVFQQQACICTSYLFGKQAVVRD